MPSELAGRYTLKRPLGEDGMATVWLGERSGPVGFRKPFAIKQMLPQYASDDALRDLFYDEARLGALLHHNNLVEVVDFGHAEGDPWIVLEYIDGPSLRQLLKKARSADHRLDVDATLHLAREIATALHYAHNATDAEGQMIRVVHRDLSPGNVLISSQGEVKVADFGVARYEGRLSRSVPGCVRGTLTWIAPEQAMGLRTDHRADIFSLGLLVYHMLTGRHPYLRQTDFETIERARRGNPRPPREFAPDIPEELELLVLRCLEPTPERRPDSAATVRTQLGWLLNERAVPEGAPTLLREMEALYGPRAAWGTREHRPWHVPHEAVTQRRELPDLEGEWDLDSDPGAPGAPRVTRLEPAGDGSQPARGAPAPSQPSFVERPRPQIEALAPDRAPPSELRSMIGALLIGAVLTALVLVATGRFQPATPPATGPQPDPAAPVDPVVATPSPTALPAPPVDAPAGAPLPLAPVPAPPPVAVAQPVAADPPKPAPPRATQPLAATPTAHTRVDTDPPGGILFLGGEELGRAPVVLSGAPDALLKVTVVMDGYPTTVQLVRLEDGGRRVLRLRR